MDVNYSMFNPSISLCENIKSSKYSFPDPNPNSYYILSEAGKDYQIVENSAILLNFNKGYYVQHFYVNDIKTSILNISNKLFANSKPIEGLAKKALELAILKNGKKVPTLNNRL
jgi:hypothetical protein